MLTDEEIKEINDNVDSYEIRLESVVQSNWVTRMLSTRKKLRGVIEDGHFTIHQIDDSEVGVIFAGQYYF